jgi:DNA-directed RNA polymerase subunit H (RpoH/RPB5)
MPTAQNVLMQAYNARKNILDMMHQTYSYDITDYEGFSTNEVDAMITNDQLDMLLTKTTEEVNQPIHKTYIKFSISTEGKSNPVSRLNQIIEDLYVLTDTLTKDDCLIMIYYGEPNDSLIAHLNYIYENSGIFAVVHNIKRLQFNILNHSLVPRVDIMTPEEVDLLYKKYHVKDSSQLPEISRHDPQAMAICLRPGQTCRFYRKSPTALETEYYRYCVT